MRFYLTIFFLILAQRSAGAPPLPDTSSSTVSHKQRLSSVVNSFSSVVSPVLSYDAKRLYFSRKYHPENIGQTRDPDDVWYCERNAQGYWTEARNLGASINTSESNVLCSISPLHGTALLQTSGATGSEKMHAFSICRYDGTRWTEPEPLIIENFRNDSKNFYAHLAFDESTLFLAIQNEKSIGGLDLFVSFRKGTSLVFSEPQNLGAGINTKSTEGSPCLGFDGNTLYFSSDGRGGFGSQDLFVSHRIDSSWTNWSEPQNLGPDVNTAHLDHCFSLSADGSHAMIISSDSLGTQGIYDVEVPVTLRMGSSLLQAEKPTLIGSIEFDLHFALNSSTVDQEELRQALAKHAPYREHSCWNLRLDAWTDSTGTELHNKLLSTHRAAAVRRALRSELGGRCMHFLSTTAHASHDPRFENRTEEGRSKNRSVRVRISLQR